MKTLEDRFWEKVDRKSENKCWEWLGGCHSGYGHFSVHGKYVSSHRFSWELHFDKIPEGLLVCHYCDNRLCVNPKHLFIGTHADNMKDAVSKGRQSKGEGHNSTKLSFKDVLFIREKLSLGVSDSQLSRDFGVWQTTIRDIRIGKTWRHI